MATPYPYHMRHKILLIDSESDAIDLLGSNLRAAGFQVTIARDSFSGLAKVATENPSLIVLDPSLPEISGFEVCRRLKDGISTRQIPILMLSAQASEAERILGFELGADDYIAKPFSPREVILRIRNSLQRNGDNGTIQHKMTLGELMLDPIGHEVAIENRLVYLTKIEFGIVALLMEYSGRVLDRETILEKVLGRNNTTTISTVNTHIRRIRIKLGTAARYIESVHGVGYRLNDKENRYTRFGTRRKAFRQRQRNSWEHGPVDSKSLSS